MDHDPATTRIILASSEQIRHFDITVSIGVMITLFVAVVLTIISNWFRIVFDYSSVWGLCLSHFRFGYAMLVFMSVKNSGFSLFDCSCSR